MASALIREEPVPDSLEITLLKVRSGSLERRVDENVKFIALSRDYRIPP